LRGRTRPEPPVSAGPRCRTGRPRGRPSWRAAGGRTRWRCARQTAAWTSVGRRARVRALRQCWKEKKEKKKDKRWNENNNCIHQKHSIL
jgi:hypothetical protein